jgi:hypothetical protein
MRVEKVAPAVDVRIGGFRMTWQRVPVRLIAFLTTGAGSALTAWWTTR